MNGRAALDHLLESGVGSVYTAVSAQVRQRGQIINSDACGWLDPDGRTDFGDPATPDTLFDLASLTKLFTTTAFLRLVSSGQITLETPVAVVLPNFSGTRPIRPYADTHNSDNWIEVVPPTEAMVDASTVTFRQLLTHSSGLPPGLKLRDLPDNAARLAACLRTPLTYPPGTQVLYSDVGFILLGEAIAKLTNLPLDAAIEMLVIKPLNLSAHYRPIAEYKGEQVIGIAPTEFCTWRKRRIVGEVHDENTAAFGGVSGHAGLFGTAADVAAIGQLYLDGGKGLIDEVLAQEAARLHIGDRGLGWMIRVSELSSSGRYFSAQSYGHTGFTGTSLWIDPERELVCALLTNSVFYGRDDEPIYQFRRAFHDTVIESLSTL